MGVGTGTLAALGAGATVLGTGVSVYGAVQQGQAQKNAADYQAAEDKNNATIASYNANIAEQNQAQKTQAIQRDGALKLGTQRAALGAAGVGIDSGSSLDVQSATTEDTGRAAVASQLQGDLTGYGYQVQEQNLTNQAAMTTAAGSNAASAGEIGAATSLLSGASQVAGKWLQYKNPNATPYGYNYASGGQST